MNDESLALNLAQAASCPPTCGLTTAQIGSIAEDWGLRAGDRHERWWMLSFIDRLGGDVRWDCRPEAMKFVASSPGCFAIGTARAFDVASCLGFLMLHLPHAEIPDTPNHPLPLIAVPWCSAQIPRFAKATREATIFAYYFLMPVRLFVDAWFRHGEDIDRVEQEFALPRPWIAARAQELQLRYGG